MPWAVRDGVRLYYERTGSGRPLLFISGTGRDLRTRPNVFDYEFASVFDTVAYDQRGLGQSDTPPGPYSMADYADDAVGVLDAVGLEHAAVIGVSFGGMVAEELVIRYPQRVTWLVLVCTSSGGAGGSSYPLHELVGPRAAERIALADTRRADPSFNGAPLPAGAGGGTAARTPTPGELLQLDARRYHDAWERLPTIDCPVFVASGRYDGIAPVANGEALTGRIPGATFAIFEGGHGFLRQDPTADGVVRSFLLAGAQP